MKALLKSTMDQLEKNVTDYVFIEMDHDDWEDMDKGLPESARPFFKLVAAKEYDGHPDTDIKQCPDSYIMLIDKNFYLNVINPVFHNDYLDEEDKKYVKSLDGDVTDQAKQLVLNCIVYLHEHELTKHLSEDDINVMASLICALSGRDTYQFGSEATASGEQQIN